MHSEDRNESINTWSETSNHTKHFSCPHWNGQGRNCALVKEGLFLPVEQHVQAYCLSGLYATCSYFQHLVGDVDNNEGRMLPPVNRRRSIRAPDRQLFRFSEITGSDQISGFREDGAWTVDRSDHGIRFATRRFLPPGTKVLYHLGAGIDNDRIDGQGRVVWSEPLANTPLFHVGIAFDNFDNHLQL